MRGWIGGSAVAVFTATGLAFATPSMAQSHWDPVPGALPATHAGASPDVRPDAYRAFTLDEAGLNANLRTADQVGLRSRAVVGPSDTVISLPAPGGGMQRFAIKESPIMEAGLAAAHPEIKTYAGVGLDDPTATLRADTTPLGFHASVRAAKGAWYVDPYYHLDTSVYVSYYARDVPRTRTASSPRRRSCASDPLDLGAPAAAAGPDVQLRTYRLALVTDPTYSTYFGGPANVTAAKVTLMNRVDQIYEDELAIRMILIDQTDKLNLNTAAAHDRARTARAGLRRATRTSRRQAARARCSSATRS